MNKGKLYLIPSPLGDNDPKEVIPAPVLESLTGFKTFVVEEIRTARRYLSRAGLKGHIGELEFHELNEHTDAATIEGYLKLFENGNDVALISEAGLPAKCHRPQHKHCKPCFCRSNTAQPASQGKCHRTDSN